MEKMREADWGDGAKVLVFVTYHHIREDTDVRFPGLHFRTLSAFRQQLRILKRHFQFPDPSDVRACLLNKGTLPERSCVVTFDDGLRDHYEYVAPILSDLKIHGLFSVNTGSWETGKLLPVHMAHLLSAAFSYESLTDELVASARRWGVSIGLAGVPMDKAIAQYRYDAPRAARVKFFINAVVPQELRPKVIGDVFRSRLGEGEDLVSMHYMSPTMVKELYKAGHTIALHSHWHSHLALQPEYSMVEDLRKNAAALKGAIGSVFDPKWISYPYGSPGSYNEKVITESMTLGCDIGLTSNRGYNKLPVKSTMELKRIDTNDMEGGKQPLSWSDLWRM